MVWWGGSAGKYATRREKKHKTPGKSIKHQRKGIKHKIQHTVAQRYSGEGVERGGGTEKGKN